MATILISAPSLDASKNVSGVSSVVRTILSVLSTAHDFVHLELGSEQKGSRLARQAGSLAKIARGAALAAFGRYDVFHSNTAADRRAVTRDALLVAIARLRGKPCIWHVHGGDYMSAPAPADVAARMRALARGVARVVVLSEREKSWFADQYGCDPSKIAVIPNGVRQSGDAASAPGPGEPLALIYAGRLTHEKGVTLLLDAVAGLGPEDGLRVTVYGDGPMRDAVVAAEGPVLRYGGTLTPAEMPAAMRAHHALVLPSMFEGMPMVVVEAMSLGLVPVCTPFASVGDLFVDGESGLVVAPEAAALRAAFGRLRADPAGTAAMGARARAYARDHYDAANNYAALGAIYADLIAG